MVSTRHHPKEFPEPELPPSLRPTSSTSQSQSQSPPPTARKSRTSGATTTTSPTKRAVSTSTAAEKMNGTAKTANGSAAAAPVNGSIQVSSPVKRSASLTSPNTSVSKKARLATLPFAHPASVLPSVHNPPPLLILWLVVSLPLVVWDTCYLFGRPHTFRGGKWHYPIWAPYSIYQDVDYVYGLPAYEAGAGFPLAQATLNAIETAGYVWYFWAMIKGVDVKGGNGGAGARGFWGRVGALLSGKHRGVKEYATPVVVGLVTCFMTVSKTVLYWLIEYYGSFSNIGHNEPGKLFWLWIVPNGLWIVLPSYMIWVLWIEIVAKLKMAEGKRVR